MRAMTIDWDKINDAKRRRAITRMLLDVQESIDKDKKPDDRIGKTVSIKHLITNKLKSCM